jgi:hypothetical protein
MATLSLAACNSLIFQERPIEVIECTSRVRCLYLQPMLAKEVPSSRGGLVMQSLSSEVSTNTKGLVA